MLGHDGLRLQQKYAERAQKRREAARPIGTELTIASQVVKSKPDLSHSLTERTRSDAGNTKDTTHTVKPSSFESLVSGSSEACRHNHEPTSEVEAKQHDSDPNVGWANGYATISSRAGNAKKSDDATALLANGFFGRELRRSALPDPSLAQVEDTDCTRRVSFDVTCDGHDVEAKTGRNSKEERRLAREQKKEARETEVLNKLKNSPEIFRLRQMMQTDSQAFQHFLDAITESNPDLMKLIAKRREEFMAILLEPEPSRTPPAHQTPQEENTDKAKEEHSLSPQKDRANNRLRQRRQLEKALKEYSPSLHPLAVSFSSFSCAVCKKFCDLRLCSDCKCARFCSKECQRLFWPRHKSVCKFLKSIGGNLLPELSGKSFETEWPRLQIAWDEIVGREMLFFERDQLLRIPNCRKCRKVPATFPCEKSFLVGYCSESCRESDGEWRDSWQCNQVGITAAVANAKHLLHVHEDTRTSPDFKLTESILKTGWTTYVNAAGITYDRVDFSKLPEVVKQIAIDQLSYPLVVLEALFLAGRSLDKLCDEQEVVDIQVLNSPCEALADCAKYIEWFCHAGPHVKFMNIHIYGIHSLEGETERDMTSALHVREDFKQRGCQLKIFLHHILSNEWLDKVTQTPRKPVMRVVFSGCFREDFEDDPYSSCSPLLRSLAKVHDDVPFVVTARSQADNEWNGQRAEALGLNVLVKPTMSSFCSPLLLVDEYYSFDDNPAQVVGWNVGFAVFASFSKDLMVSREQELLKLVQDFVITTDIFKNGTHADDEYHDRDLETNFGENDVEQVCPEQDDAVHVTNLCRHGVLTHSFASQMQGAVVFSLPGPFIFDGSSYDDLALDAEKRPKGSFSVQFWVRCDAGGNGFRSPITARDDPPAGYVFYINDQNRWTFWVGDSNTNYWAGIDGPEACIGVWTYLVGVVDIVASEIKLYVNNELVGSRSQVAFVENRQRPLRLGAGRSESSKPHFWFTGEIEGVMICEHGS